MGAGRLPVLSTKVYGQKFTLRPKDGCIKKFVVVDK